MRLPLVLASSSPRRQELLASAGIAFEIRPPDVDEALLPNELPLPYAERLARQKAERVQKDDRERPVLAADTIVVIDSTVVLGKPTSPADAARMLAALSGRSHQVITAYHLQTPTQSRGRAVHTDVVLRALTEDEQRGYIAGLEWEGKAGGYAIQGRAAAFIREIRGSYSNVVGLPLCEVVEDLRALGIIAADWAKPALAAFE